LKLDKFSLPAVNTLQDLLRHPKPGVGEGAAKVLRSVAPDRLKGKEMMLGRQEFAHGDFPRREDTFNSFRENSKIVLEDFARRENSNRSQLCSEPLKPAKHTF